MDILLDQSNMTYVKRLEIKKKGEKERWGWGVLQDIPDHHKDGRSLPPPTQGTKWKQMGEADKQGLLQVPLSHNGLVVVHP